MISRSLKAAYYVVMQPPMKASGFFYRHLLAPRTGRVKAHLGPGQANYLPNWVNVDANLTAKIDVWADLRDRLPFRDATVDAFYSHHMVEHLPDARLPFHFAEMFRCLKPGGAIRVGGPNGDSAIRKYLEGDTDWFSDYPDKRQSVGGRLANFIFCRGEHLTLLTPSYVSEIALAAGFRDIATRRPQTETGFPELFAEVLELERESSPEVPHTLIVEAVKPRASS
jgi:predicted SAM-dependent methyltransferase